MWLLVVGLGFGALAFELYRQCYGYCRAVFTDGWRFLLMGCIMVPTTVHAWDLCHLC